MLARIDSHILRLNRWALIVMLSVMSLLTFSNVTLRFLTSHSMVWAEEVSRHLMIWLTFIGAGLVLRAGGHIAADNLQEYLPQRGARIVRASVAVLLLVFFAAMAWQGVNYIAFQWGQTTAVLQIPFGFVYAAMPVGFVLMIYHLLQVAAPFILERRFHIDEDGYTMGATQ